MAIDTTKVNPRDVLVDESKQRDIENPGDCMRALDVGHSLGNFSLAATKGVLDQLVGEFSAVTTPSLFRNAVGG
jgi:hypothetical protein